MAINEFVLIKLMVNPFEKTQPEKEKCVIEMLELGYGWNQIMRECHVSPNTISDIKKKFSGQGPSGNGSQLGKETQALKLFKEGWKPLDIAIQLDIPPDAVFQIQENFYRLIGLDKFNQAYRQINGNLGPFLELIDSMNRFRMNAGQIMEAIKYGNALPHLQDFHLRLITEIHALESYKNKLSSVMNWMGHQIENYKYSLNYCINEFNQKSNELLALDYQIKNMQNFIQEFDNHEGYQRIRKESTEQTESILKNNPLLMAITVTASLEAIRRYPYNQELFYDLSTPRVFSSSNQQTLMNSHTEQLSQFAEQVRLEMVDNITKAMMNSMRNNPHDPKR